MGNVIIIRRKCPRCGHRSPKADRYRCLECGEAMVITNESINAPYILDRGID